MIPVTTFSGKSALVFGLGGSGLATAKALLAGGARVLVFDDRQASVERAQEEGLQTQDLRDIDFAEFDALVLAPGVPLTHPEPHWTVKKAHAAGIEIIGDVELFNRERLARAPKSRFIAVTGTNGKSTTSALIAHVLSNAGLKVELGGNIGRAVLTFDDLADDKTYVVECSSYQIDLAPTLKPSIGVLLNISPDHIDRHGTYENYADVKARLVAQSDLAIIGCDDEKSASIADQVRQDGGELRTVSLSSQADVTGQGTSILIGDHPIADVAGITSLKGAHNLQNASVAAAVCQASCLSNQEIQLGLSSFPGLPHRMEQVIVHDGVAFINDSKATNADAAAWALASFENIYWILGGRAKDGGITSLNDFFPRIRQAFLIGEAAGDFAQSLDGKVPFSLSGTLDQAVAEAVQKVSSEMQEGQKATVLFSPACASFDQYSSFETRGDAFKELVFKTLK